MTYRQMQTINCLPKKSKQKVTKMVFNFVISAVEQTEAEMFVLASSFFLAQLACLEGRANKETICVSMWWV